MPDIYDSQKHNPLSKKEGAPEPRVEPVSPKRRPQDYSEVIRTTKPTTNPLATFIVNPRDVQIDIQNTDEKVLILLRRHFITNLGWLFIVALMILAPILLFFLPFESILPLRFNIATVFLWYLLTFAIALEGFLSWYFNSFIITDERVIDIDFLNLIYKDVSTTKIDNIEDVSVQMGGALRSVLNFGTVYIQTAGEQRQFEFEDVPEPQSVAKLLNELMLEEEREKLEGRVS